MNYEQLLPYVKGLDAFWAMMTRDNFTAPLDYRGWAEFTEAQLGPSFRDFFSGEGISSHYEYEKLLSSFRAALQANPLSTEIEQEQPREYRSYLFGFDLSGPGDLPHYGFDFLRNAYVGWLERNVLVPVGAYHYIKRYLGCLRKLAREREALLSASYNPCLNRDHIEAEVAQLWDDFRMVLGAQEWFLSHISLDGQPVTPLTLPASFKPYPLTLAELHPVFAEKYPKLGKEINKVLAREAKSKRTRKPKTTT